MTDHLKSIISGRQGLFLFILGLVVTVIFIRYAEIIKDGDLWFHLAYGKYMLQNHTLVPDHTIYSWSPAAQDTIYCAWIAELLFYGMHSLSGISAFFALRYLCILAFLVLILLSMRRNHALLNPLAWLMVLTGLFMCRSAMDIKPELFSFIFMAISVWAWLRGRSTSEESWRYFYLLPATMLVWVNTHGGFIFGILFLALTATGEILNYLFSPQERLSRTALQHLLVSMFISCIALCITPYGPAYPLQLFHDLVLNNREQLKEFRTVGAYQSIFHDAAGPLHFIDYLIISAGSLMLLFFLRLTRGRLNWALLLPNIGLAVLYMQFIRTTYFFGVLSCFTAIELLGQGAACFPQMNRRLRISLSALTVVLCILLSSREIYESLCRPSFGFGLNYYSPVEEAQYIRDHLLGYRLGNDYNCGTYLLWKLWPEAKVFIDARYFPYRGWYKEYAEFVYGRDNQYKHDFLQRYGCEVWCATYDFPRLSYFIGSDRWKLVYYGPSACIFALSELGVPAEKASFTSSISTIPTEQSLKILNFAVSVGDMDNAVFIGMHLDRDFCTADMKRQMSLSFIKLGDALNKKKRADDSIHFFNQALSMYPSQEPAVYDTLGTLYLNRSDFDKALVHYRKALDIKPDYQPALHNMAFAYTQKGDYEHALDCLDKLLKLGPENPEIYYNIACIHARRNMPDEALKWLELAVKKGFSDFKMLESDRDLAPLKKMQGFRDIFP